MATHTAFHPTTDGFGTLSVKPRVDTVRPISPALAAAGFILSVALGLATLYQADHALFAPATPVAHGEIFAVDMD